MRSAIVALFTFLLGSIAPAGQSTPQNQGSYGVAGMEGLNTPTNVIIPALPKATNSINPPASLCPVSPRAQYRADGGLLNVDKGRPEAPGQSLRLILTNRDPRRMVEARLRVHGLSGKVHITKTPSGSNRPDATATIDVRLFQGAEQGWGQGPGQEAYGDLRVPNMTAVLSIDLNSVTYADGSTERFAGRAALAGREACRFAPDLIMVNAGR